MESHKARMPSVNEEMELLIKLNDLELLIKEVEAEEARAVEQGLGFKMSDGGEREHLLAVRKRLRDGIRPESLGQFDRAWKRYGRALAPVNNGVCCGWRGSTMRAPSRRAILGC